MSSILSYAALLLSLGFGQIAVALPANTAPQTIPRASATEFRPALWKVRADQGTMYLFGSIHFGRADFYPLPGVVEKAFAESKVLVVEVNIDAVPPLVLLRKAMAYGMLPLEQNAKELVSPQTWSAVERSARTFSLPIQTLERQKPWFIAMTMTALGVARLGLDPAQGIDKYFLARAGTRKVIDLETVDSQLSAFDSLPKESDEALLAQTLLDLRSPAALEKLLKAWRTGNLAALNQQIVSGHFARDPKGLAKKVLLDERNVAMTDKLTKLAFRDGPYFVVIGAGHFVGSGNIVELLRKRHLQVDRIN
ncbi:MAG: TraB/GumN family protein [Gammaproteobacteria bacterium]|nr:TraB/GumN family protein [Gammaproteobacteria bacterium]